MENGSIAASAQPILAVHGQKQKIAYCNAILIIILKIKKLAFSTPDTTRLARVFWQMRNGTLFRQLLKTGITAGRPALSGIMMFPLQRRNVIINVKADIIWMAINAFLIPKPLLAPGLCRLVSNGEQMENAFRLGTVLSGIRPVARLPIMLMATIASANICKMKNEGIAKGDAIFIVRDVPMPLTTNT